MQEVIINQNNCYVLHIYAKDATERSDEVYYFLHGVPATQIKNEDIARAVVKSTQKDVIVIHYRGLGKSTTIDPSFDFIASIEDTLALANILTCDYRRIHLIGHSWGGCVALNIFRESLLPAQKAGQVILLAPFVEFPDDVPWLIPLIKEGRLPLKAGVNGAYKNFYAVKDIYPPKKSIHSLCQHDNQFTIIEAIDDPDVPNEQTTNLYTDLKQSSKKVQFYRLCDDHLFSNNRNAIIEAVLGAINICTQN